MLKAKEWKIEYQIPEIPHELLAAGYPPLLAYVLTIRNITTAEEAHAFIDSSSTPLHDPFLLGGMEEAVNRIRLACGRNEKVVVYGDYDVDGITSTCLLVSYLTEKGLSCTPYIPDRNEEGYGLNCAALDRFSADGISLVITVDCGITALEEARHATSLGIDMIITDHHECKGNALPEVCALIDPKLPGDAYPNNDLAGVGVAFKLLCACEGRSDEMLEQYADLVAIGTVADVMELTGENRYLVKYGIEKLKKAPRPGLAAMLKEAGMKPDNLTASSIGYVIAPRLNAAGRLDKAMRAADLLRCSSTSEASSIAAFLCDLNRKRQEKENLIWKEAVQRIGKLEPKDPIVLESDSWDQGVIGIAASRLADQYSVPTIMICLNNDVGKGSCRSFGGFNLYEALSACSEHLLSFGGHALAAGLNIRKEKIDDFRNALASYYAANPPEAQNAVVCDLLITDPQLLTVENVRSLDLLEPYGNGNLKPVFCMTGMKLESFSNVGSGKHLKMRLSAGDTGFDAIFFSHTSGEFQLREGEQVDVAFCPQVNEFRGSTSVQLIVSALREHDGSVLCSDILEKGCSYDRAAARYCPERTDFVQVWKALGSGFRLGNSTDAILRFCPAGMPEETFCICLSVFREAGLLDTSGPCVYGGRIRTLPHKADLEGTELLQRLRKNIGNE